MVPREEAYCTDQVDTSTAVAPLLRNSMKSLLSVAPALPPEPYTWLITTCACAAPIPPHSNPTASASWRTCNFIDDVP